MLTIKDIVELAKAGYKPGDVKELIEISKSNNDTSDAAAPDPSIPLTPANKSDPSTGAADPEESEDIDYKELYEKTKIELDNTRSNLDKAQKANTRSDISTEDDDISDTDILKDLFKEFM